MSTQPPAPRQGLDPATLAAGVVIILALMAAFLWGEEHDVDTSPLLAIISPVVGALFLVPRLGNLQQTTQQVQRNTNGHLTLVTAERDRLTEQNAKLREQLAAATSSSEGAPVSADQP